MTLPPYVRYCLDTLEQAGFPAYVVGGCVRDACLGLEPQDFDVCTAALPEQTEALFSPHRLILAGKKHGTVAVVLEGIVEITTFRSEGGYDDHRHPGWVRFQPDVESDLARRDFTVNAMAFSPTRGLADPFGGGADLKSKTLRAVGDPETRFREDALRILRGVRFAVKYGLTVEENTLRAMERQAFSLNDLARERVFEELCKLLPLVNAEDLLRFAPILAAAIPELKPTMGFDQRTPHHVYDVFTHIAHVVEGVGPDLPSRWAALLHDVGKPAAFTMDENGRGHFKGHAPISAAMAGDIHRPAGAGGISGGAPHDQAGAGQKSPPPLAQPVRRGGGGAAAASAGGGHGRQGRRRTHRHGAVPGSAPSDRGNSGGGQLSESAGSGSKRP